MTDRNDPVATSIAHCASCESWERKASCPHCGSQMAKPSWTWADTAAFIGLAVFVWLGYILITHYTHYQGV